MKCTFLPHVRAQTHIQFFTSHSNQTHTLQKIPKSTRICSHLQNKTYKTTSRFLPNLTTPGKYHTEQKQNQNRKRIGKNFFFFTLCHHTFENPFLLLFLIICLLALPHPNYNPDSTINNFLWHHIIVNIISIRQVMSKPFFTQTLPYFFLINSLQSISTFKTKNL